jgi:DNA-binding SARP family transcriptional activator
MGGRECRPPLAELRLLGGFELRRNGLPVELSPPTQRLVAFLALQERPQKRVETAGRLWPNSSEDRAAANLRTVLWRLRKRHLDVVVESGPLLSIAAHVWIDTAELNRVAALLWDSGSTEIEWNYRCLDGDLLVDWDDDFVMIARERIRQRRLHALEECVRRFASAERYADAVEAALAAVAAEPLRESARRAVISIHLAEGNVVEAVRQYEAFRALLHDELGLDPSPQLTEMISRFVPARRAV